MIVKNLRGKFWATGVRSWS